MTKNDLQKYESLGWDFFLEESYFNEVEWAIYFKSPRMDRHRSLHWSKLKKSFDEFWAETEERDLLKSEAMSYAASYVDRNRYKIECQIRDAIIAGEKQITVEIK